MDFSHFSADLLSWYDAHARKLPWRENPLPYYVWVSEIMLQQTRVEAVKPYFDRFLRAFPTIRDLAEAKEEVLLKMWEGLGYYNRARNLQSAAKTIVSEYGGVFPSSYEQILALPGIGEYTAGAISSIAFGIPTPAIDGNVLRVFSRILENGADVSKQSAKKFFREFVSGLIPSDRAGDFNQALMELGAIVCVPNGDPLCSSCPVAHYCLGFQHGTAKSFPVLPPKKQRSREKLTVFLLLFPKGIALRKRPETGLLAGLFEFPNCSSHLTPAQAEESLLALGLDLVSVEPFGDSKHVFTHVEWQMRGYLARIAGGALPSGWVLADRASFEQFALPSAFRYYTKKITALL